MFVYVSSQFWSALISNYNTPEYEGDIAPLPGIVHHRDILTKGAAVCLISPAHMREERRLGQPKVYRPFLTSIVLMETIVS